MGAPKEAGVSDDPRFLVVHQPRSQSLSMPALTLGGDSSGELAQGCMQASTLLPGSVPKSSREQALSTRFRIESDWTPVASLWPTCPLHYRCWQLTHHLRENRITKEGRWSGADHKQPQRR